MYVVCSVFFERAKIISKVLIEKIFPENFWKKNWMGDIFLLILVTSKIRNYNMNRIKYSETGQFTDAQCKLCQEIAVRLKKLQKSGCSIIAKQDSLHVFLSKELQYSNLINLRKSYSNDYPIPYLDAGRINDAGADDTEFFIDEVIEEEYD